MATNLAHEDDQQRHFDAGFYESAIAPRRVFSFSNSFGDGQGESINLRENLYLALFHFSDFICYYVFVTIAG